jgi:uncharacterized protein
MLSFDIRSLESQAAVVDEVLPGDDPVWESDDPVPEGGIRVVGRLSSAGPGRFYWHGSMEGRVLLACRRCLVDAGASTRDEMHVIFAEPGVEESDDPDIFQLDPRANELDLRPVIREQWLLSVPKYALCREDCRGLCPRCGSDLNTTDCGCAPQEDSRWEGLRKARP